MSNFKVQLGLSSIVKSIANSKITKLIIGICIVALVAFLIYSGIGFIAACLAVLAILFGIFLGGIREVVGSIIIAGILNTVKTDLTNLINIWTDNPKLLNTINYLSDLDFMKCAFIIFFIAYTISFLTGSVKLLNVSNHNSNENKELVKYSENKELNETVQ